MLAILLLGIGTLAIFAFSSKASFSAKVQSFEPKDAVEVLKNMVHFSVLETGLYEGLADEVALIPWDATSKSEGAFKDVIQWNGQGRAILALKTMANPNAWGGAKLLVLPAGDNESIRKLAAVGSPWAVLIRTPHRLDRFANASASQFVSNISVSDVA